MNTFKYQMTILPDFQFNKFIDGKRQGEVSISASIGIPKDLSKNRKVKCDLLVEAVNSITKETDIKFKSISVFDIISPEIFVDSLLEDAADYCIPIALEKTDQKFEAVSKILMGHSISLQLSQHIHEE